jgi:CRP-like cAMP-binding protein
MHNENRNSLLAMLNPAKHRLLFTYLTPFSADINKILHEQDDAVDYVYFPSQGMVSLVTLMKDGRLVETGAVGFDGAIGLNSALSDRRSPCRSIVQLPLTAQRVPKALFKQAYENSEDIRAIVHLANELLIEQTQQEPPAMPCI